MKSKQTNEGRENANGRNSLGEVCVKSCKGILAQISKTKDAIFEEARGTLKEQDQMLRLALNKAEALVWQRLYPHLIFQALAGEKIQEVAAWNSRQRLFGRQTQLQPV